MNPIQLDEITHLIQISTAPVFLLAGVGAAVIATRHLRFAVR